MPPNGFKRPQTYSNGGDRSLTATVKRGETQGETAQRAAQLARVEREAQQARAAVRSVERQAARQATLAAAREARRLEAHSMAVEALEAVQAAREARGKARSTSTRTTLTNPHGATAGTSPRSAAQAAYRVALDAGMTPAEAEAREARAYARRAATEAKRRARPPLPDEHRRKPLDRPEAIVREGLVCELQGLIRSLGGNQRLDRLAAEVIALGIRIRRLYGGDHLSASILESLRKPPPAHLTLDKMIADLTAWRDLYQRARLKRDETEMTEAEVEAERARQWVLREMGWIRAGQKSKY